MTENQQDLVPLVMGQERGEGSKMLPRCLQLSWGNRSAFGGGGKISFGDKVAIEGSEDKQGTSTRQVDRARARSRHPDVAKRGRLLF